MASESQFSENALKRQKLIRDFGRVCLASMVVSILPDIYFGLWKSTLFTLLMGLPFWLILVVNRQYIDTASNLLIFWLLFVLIYFSVALGRESNIHMMLLVIIIAIPFTIDPQKKFLIYIHITLPILIYLFLEFNDFKLSFISPMPDVSLAHTKTFGSINLLVIFIIIPLITVVILRSNQRFAEEIHQTNEQLQNRNHELTKKNEALDQFAYRVSHDLRSPIASLKGLLNILQGETQISEIQQYHQLMQKSLFRLDDFIRDILDQAQNLRTELNISPLDLHQTIKDIYDQLKFTNPDSRVELRLHIENHTPEFASDLYRLKIIFHNLIANAIRYHDPKKNLAWLHISGFIDAQHANLRLEDNGLGIAKEHQAKVFEMFYRANSHTKGSGLGLFLVKECVEKLGGTIAMQSEMGKGTVFELKIPNNNLM
ncbi:MAG: HAMP domain-containing histidine kinase [Microscillaceae bacterium]|jgi:signal transduction histidine kinase|nr:HAMP domain-containing histidine kinase [Microscillaceae bacterium]